MKKRIVAVLFCGLLLFCLEGYAQNVIPGMSIKKSADWLRTPTEIGQEFIESDRVRPFASSKGLHRSPDNTIIHFYHGFIYLPASKVR